MDNFDNRDERRNSGRPKGEPPRSGMSWRGTGRSLFFWLAIVLVAIFGYQYLAGDLGSSQAQITFSEFTEQIDKSNISEVTFTNREVQGKLKEPQQFASTETTN
ncbi:hypothetical protein C3F09_04595, partial [candidate division GN15 bacterium]